MSDLTTTKNHLILHVAIPSGVPEFHPPGNLIGRVLLKALFERVCSEVGAGDSCLAVVGDLNDSWFLFQTDCPPKLIAGIISQLKAVGLDTLAHLARTDHDEIIWRTVFPVGSNALDTDECHFQKFASKAAAEVARIDVIRQEIRKRIAWHEEQKRTLGT